MRTLFQLADLVGSDVEAQIERTLLDVKIASAERRWMARPGDDHDMDTTTGSPCSSPIDDLAVSIGSRGGQSSELNFPASNRIRGHGEPPDFAKSDFLGTYHRSETVFRPETIPPTSM